MEKLHYIVQAKQARAARERAASEERARRASLPATWENFTPARTAGEIRLEIEWNYIATHGKHHTKTADCALVEFQIMQAQLAEKDREEMRVFAILQAHEKKGG